MAKKEATETRHTYVSSVQSEEKLAGKVTHKVEDFAQEQSKKWGDSVNHFVRQQERNACVKTGQAAGLSAAGNIGEAAGGILAGIIHDHFRKDADDEGSQDYRFNQLRKKDAKLTLKMKFIMQAKKDAKAFSLKGRAKQDAKEGIKAAAKKFEADVTDETIDLICDIMF